MTQAQPSRCPVLAATLESRAGPPLDPGAPGPCRAPADAAWRRDTVSSVPRLGRGGRADSSPLRTSQSWTVRPGWPPPRSTRMVDFHFLAAPRPARRSNSVGETSVPLASRTTRRCGKKVPCRPRQTTSTDSGASAGLAWGRGGPARPPACGRSSGWAAWAAGQAASSDPGRTCSRSAAASARRSRLSSCEF